MKKCILCEKEKQDNEFNKDKRYKDGLFCYCKSCQTAKKREHRNQKYEQYITTDLMRSYGISYEDKLIMIKQQNFKCPICKSEISYDNKAAVDHCHKSGKIRGILCGSCNRGVGLLQDSVEVFEAAIQYLKKHLL